MHADFLVMCVRVRRTLQTAAYACEGLGIPPEKWTITCLVGEVSLKGMVQR